MTSSAFADAVRSLGLELRTGQIDQLAGFRDLLAASANEFNLTSLRDPESIERRHIMESLAFGALLDRRGLLRPIGDAMTGAVDDAIRVLDIGAGAGLPGIPLKIAWPALRLTLLESIGKKCRFLELARDTLGLRGVLVAEARAEDFGRDLQHRGTYDLAVARAVAPLPVLLEYALPMLRTGGRLAAPKGSAAPSELTAAGHALGELGGEVEAEVAFTPPFGQTQTVIFVAKTRATPERYPRRPGIPSKRTL